MLYCQYRSLGVQNEDNGFSRGFYLENDIRNCSSDEEYATCLGNSNIRAARKEDISINQDSRVLSLTKVWPRE